MISSFSSPENMEPWNLKPILTDSWLSEAFARDTHTLTAALQKTFSTNSSSTASDININININNNIHHLLFNNDNMVKPESASTLQTPSVSGSDHEASPPPKRSRISNGKITKRKSRASKRNTTTFINADPSNFRQMVQQVTGVRIGDGHVPVASIMKPEPQRIVGGHRFQGCLPTLDTSAFFLASHAPATAVGQQTTVGYSTPPDAAGGGGFDDFESFSGFPTLESWKVNVNNYSS